MKTNCREGKVGRVEPRVLQGREGRRHPSHLENPWSGPALHPGVGGMLHMGRAVAAPVPQAPSQLQAAQ